MEESSYMYKSADHAANLNNMRLSGEFCDVVIKAKNKEFPAHKVILAANLEFFKWMFLNFNEDTKQSKLVSMQDFNETYLEVFILFAYSGRILLTEANVSGVLQMAIDLKENKVKTACTKFLKDHLKVENACHVFAIANRVRCLSLKNAARFIISSDFESCSQTQEFLKFEYESMKHILSKTIVAYPNSRQILFEGLIGWVQHNVNDRRNCANDLFNIIDLAKLDKDYLLEYVSEHIDNESFIVKDVMSSYRNHIRKNKDASQLSLILIGNTNNQKLHAQVWDSSGKKWSIPHQIMQPHGHRVLFKNGTIFDHTLYNLIIDQTKKNKIHLAELITPEMHYRTLISDSKLIRDSAMCASSQFIYLCGGREEDGFASAQFMRYDPRKNCLEILPNMSTKRWGATSVFCQGCIYVLGGYDDSSNLLDSVERYDPITTKWSTLGAIHTQYIHFGVAVFNYKLYIGHGEIVVYNPFTEKVQSVAGMQKKRYNFPLVSYQGKLLAVGGDLAKTIEEYDPAKNQWKVNPLLSAGIQIIHPKCGLITCNQSRKRVGQFEEVEKKQKRPKLKPRKPNRITKKVIST